MRHVVFRACLLDLHGESPMAVGVLKGIEVMITSHDESHMAVITSPLDQRCAAYNCHAL